MTDSPIDPTLLERLAEVSVRTGLNLQTLTLYNWGELFTTDQNEQVTTGNYNNFSLQFSLSRNTATWSAHGPSAAHGRCSTSTEGGCNTRRRGPMAMSTFCPHKWVRNTRSVDPSATGTAASSTALSAGPGAVSDHMRGTGAPHSTAAAMASRWPQRAATTAASATASASHVANRGRNT